MRRTVLITGATDGLGRALAGRAHREGWDVLAHGRSDERLEQVAGELDGVRTFRADLAALADVAALAMAVEDRAPRLDVLVNNAGIGAQIIFTFDLAHELDPDEVTANALHPGTYMPTKMVTGAGIAPLTPLEHGVDATWRLIADPALEGISGRYYNGTRESRPDGQALDTDDRRALRELSERLTGATIRPTT